jgi:hypothetical protein
MDQNTDNSEVTPGANLEHQLTSPPNPVGLPRSLQPNSGIGGLRIWIGLFILILLAIVIGIGSSAFSGYQESENDPFNNRSVVEVNERIAKKNYFSLQVPDLSACWPPEDLFKSDQKKWQQSLIDCAASEWGTGLWSEDSSTTTQLVYSDSIDQAESGCTKQEAGTPPSVAAAFCRNDGKIYVFAQYMPTSSVEQAQVLLHEYTHVLAWSAGITADSVLFIADLYMKQPDQPNSRTVADENNRKRIELHAECVSWAQLSKSQKLDSTDAQPIIAAAQRSITDDTNKSYGSAEARKDIYENAKTASTLQACNTWRLTDREL